MTAFAKTSCPRHRRSSRRLSRDLLLLEQGQKEGRTDPDLLNDIFRAVHTLKGLAGMFGMAPLSSLAHTLENLLDDLRLGRLDITQETLDVLFEGVERIQRILASDDGQDALAIPALHSVAPRESPVAANVPAEDLLAEFQLGESVLSVLTEYEEHRLRHNVAQGVKLYRLRRELRTGLHRHGARGPEGPGARGRRADHLPAQHGRRQRGHHRAGGAAGQQAPMSQRCARCCAARTPCWKQVQKHGQKRPETVIPSADSRGWQSGRERGRQGRGAACGRAQPTGQRGGASHGARSCGRRRAVACARSPTPCASTSRSSTT